MRKIRIFISSVQSEFAEERQALFEYLHSDPLLGKFFEPFIFERFPASGKSVSKVYFKEIEQCDIYIGLLGTQYGTEDEHGISATEREFDHAGLFHKTRLIFLTNHGSDQRSKKINDLIGKAEKLVVRKQFSSVSGLKSAVYASLIKYLEEREFLRSGPFDATFHHSATLDDLDPEKIWHFVALASGKRGLPFQVESSQAEILEHLNLYSQGRVTNAALLLFGKRPQHFFITSEVKCVQFHGYDITKPIPSYQVYKGDLFQLINQSLDFVLSRIDLTVGERHQSVEAPLHYELPRAAVAEAIVNAIVHRDYTSNASVQVMLFKDRLEIWNPGTLPIGLTPEKLKGPHPSIPGNPLLAEPMYLAGYIERMGTGTRDIFRLCNEAGLKTPEFIQDDIFKVVLWRNLKEDEPTGEPTGEVTGEVSGEVTGEVQRLILAMEGEEKRADIQLKLGLGSDDYFRVKFILPGLESGCIEMKYPESPNHPQQRYRLTAKGIALRKSLMS